MEAFGQVDKLVCCAGVTFIGSLENTEYNTFMREISINLGGVFNMCKAAVKRTGQSSEDPSIVTIGSDLGVRPIPERIGYCPSKAGVIMLTKCIALEYAPKVRVNCVLPGLVRTPMTEQRFLDAEDPAALEEVLRFPVPPAQDGQSGRHGQRRAVPLLQRGQRLHHRRDYERLRRQPDLREEHHGYIPV